MAIQIYCVACRSSFGLDAKECSKCGIPFKRDKKYRVTVSVKGTRVNRIVDNLALAREAEAAIKTDLLREQFRTKPEKAKPAPILDEVWDKYLEWAKANKKTWDDDRFHYIKHLQPRFGAKRLDEISPLDIEKMKFEMSSGLNKNGKPFANQSIKHYLALLRRIIKGAIRWEMYDGKNPMAQVKMPHVDSQKNEFLTDEETGRLLKILETWPCRETVAFVKFAMFTGCRRSELFHLRWEDVDFQRGYITIRNPKGGRTQTIPISPSALDVLRNQKVTAPFVFPGNNGQQRTDFKAPWLRIRKAAKLPSDFRFHGLRHHFASTLVSNGVDLAIVKELLTHKDIATTQRYAHLRPDAVKQVAARTDQLLIPQASNETSS